MLIVERGTVRNFIFILAAAVLFALSAIAARAQTDEVWVLEISGPVTPAMAAYFERGIKTAEESNAAAVIIILDTPGGGLDTTQEIVRLLRAASVPIIVYISPSGAQAASAGSIITIAAHFAAMAPETVIGAASPVGDGGAELDETISRKLIEDMKAQIRALAERRGKEAVALAEAMIEDARAVNAKEAVEVGLVDLIADDLDHLLDQLDGQVMLVDGTEVTPISGQVSTRTFAMSFIESALHALSNPLFVSILLAIGVQAILIELSSPGGWVAGFIGVICLGLAFYGLGQLPANWFGLGLVAVAFVLFFLEVKAPTHGALALAGTATLIAGLLVLFNSPGSPEFARISVPGAVGLSITTAAFFIFLVTMTLRAQRTPPITGMASLVGRRGTVRTTLTSTEESAPYTGSLLVNGELWRVTSDEPLAKGTQAVVTRAEGFTLHIKDAGS